MLTQSTVLSMNTAPPAKKSPHPVPVLRPKLPSAAEILPYLHAIDSRNVYSNYGPLVMRLEQELSRHLGARDQTLITVSNATSGITAALLSLGIKEDSLCLMPSWTFAATPHAALAAGLTPLFEDVDHDTWALDPDAVREKLQNGCPIGAVIVVSPFGSPIDIQAWEHFQRETGVPVLVDAAAGFDTATPSSLLTVVSLHATKILAAGEGGFVLTDSPVKGRRIRACCNFGFEASRVARCRSINAKMSEYHAAVGMASLAQWPAIRSKHLKIMDWYRQALAPVPGVSLQPGYGTGWATATTSVILPPGSAAHVADSLLRSGIETRAWWGQGCHVQPAFRDCPRAELPITEDLGSRVLGLPHFPDMDRDTVRYVVASLAQALRSHASQNSRVHRRAS